MKMIQLMSSGMDWEALHDYEGLILLQFDWGYGEVSCVQCRDGSLKEVTMFTVAVF